MKRRWEPVRLTDEGGAYVLSVPAHFTVDDVEYVRESWRAVTGARLVILDSDVKLLGIRRSWWTRRVQS